MLTNSRLHHLQCYKQTQNITQWLASTVVLFQCLFIVRQETAELFESRRRGVQQVVRLPRQWSHRKWTPLLVSSGLEGVRWHKTVHVGSERRGKANRACVSSMLQVVQWAFSVKSLWQTTFHPSMAKKTTRAVYTDSGAGSSHPRCRIPAAHLLLEEEPGERDGCYLTSKQSRYSWARS